MKATVYVPADDPRGTDLSAIRESVARDLCERFGRWIFVQEIAAVDSTTEPSRNKRRLLAYMLVLDERRLNELREVFAPLAAVLGTEKIRLELIDNVEVRLIGSKNEETHSSG